TGAALPPITDPVVLDGWSQGVFLGMQGYQGPPLIQLDGQLLPTDTAVLTISAGGSKVRGLSITAFLNNAGTGTSLKAKGLNRIQGNYIGLDPAGNAPQGLPYYTQDTHGPSYGVQVSDGSSINYIGTDGDGQDDLSERNVISANYWGVVLRGYSYLPPGFPQT